MLIIYFSFGVHYSWQSHCLAVVSDTKDIARHVNAFRTLRFGRDCRCGGSTIDANSISSKSLLLSRGGNWGQHGLHLHVESEATVAEVAAGEMDATMGTKGHPQVINCSNSNCTGVSSFMRLLSWLAGWLRRGCWTLWLRQAAWNEAQWVDSFDGSEVVGRQIHHRGQPRQHR